MGDNRDSATTLFHEQQTKFAAVIAEQRQGLYWDASYAIALSLMRAHPDVELENVTLLQVFDWVLALPEFADDPDLANDDMLVAIYQDWYEEVIPYDK